MKKTKNKVIIIFGPPGSGKGTQGTLLAEKLNLFYWESSKIIEDKIMKAGKKDFQIVEGKKYFLADEKKLWANGILCSPPLVTFWFMEKIEKLFKDDMGIIMTGSPRTIYEGKKLIALLKKLYKPSNVKVILIGLTPEQTIFRNSHRRICELMRHPILYTPETANLRICPLDGSKLLKRKGLDDPETIKVRLREYKERTFPLVKLFEDSGLKVKKINGEQSVSEVFEDILKAIK